MAEKLASALLELQRLRGDPIDREHAKLMTAEQICSLFQYDHASGYACHGADNHPTKLTPLLIADHREKTAKTDLPAIAKGKKIAAKHEEFKRRLLRKSGVAIDEPYKPKQKQKIPSRPFPKIKRPFNKRTASKL
jgi:hypothetical protein